jgi:hypothetical protein
MPSNADLVHLVAAANPLQALDREAELTRHQAHAWAQFHWNEYDDATMKALVACFRTFTAQEKR